MAMMTSGAIQQGVPTKVFAGSTSEADPKSPNFTSPLPVSKMFAALMSLTYGEECEH